VDAVALIEHFAFHKYPKSRAAERAFMDRAIRAYDRWIEIRPDEFGRMQGKS
jgi:hypothetical protein